MINYIAVINKETGKDYNVSFPDFPGCKTECDDVDNAKEMADEALTTHIENMMKFNEKIPDASKFEDIKTDPNYSDAVAFLVVTVQS